MLGVIKLWSVAILLARGHLVAQRLLSSPEVALAASGAFWRGFGAPLRVVAVLHVSHGLYVAAASHPPTRDFIGSPAAAQ